MFKVFARCGAEVARRAKNTEEKVEFKKTDDIMLSREQLVVSVLMRCRIDVFAEAEAADAPHSKSFLNAL